MTTQADRKADREVDGGFSGDAVEQAELLWARLPVGRKWSGLATYEKALVLHTFAAHREATERQIVEWLRSLENDGSYDRGLAVSIRHACAGAIERGEHRAIRSGEGG